MSPTRIASQLIAATLFCCLLIPGDSDSVQAYASTRAPNGALVRWNLASTTQPNVSDGRIYFEIQGNGTRHHSGITGSRSEFEAIQQSFARWRDVAGTNLEFEYRGTTTTASINGNDDRNLIAWTQGTLDDATYAETVVSYDATTGEILDADLEFNDRDFVWDTLPENPSTGSPTLAYIENIATHEIGHFVGLDHTFLSDSTLFATTSRGAFSMTTLESDDRVQLLRDYPASNEGQSATASISGNVSLSGNGVFGAVITLIDTTSGQPVISALSDRNGTGSSAGDYQIDGVATGSYLHVVTPVNSPASLGSYYNGIFTAFTPTVAGVTPGSSGTPAIQRVGPESPVTGANVAVVNLANAFEPNNTSTSAKTTAIGDALCARVETNSDEDWYSFTCQAGEQVSVRCYSYSIGQDLDPYLTIYASNATTKIVSGDANDLAQNFYQASARDLNASAFTADAVNFDALASFTAQTAGLYYVVVRSQKTDEIGNYLLWLTSDRSTPGPDTGTSTLTSNQRSQLAGGADATISIQLRSLTGRSVTTTHNVELLDLSGATPVVLDSSNAAGPAFNFLLSPLVSAGIRTLGARVDGNLMLATLQLPTANAVDPSQSLLVTHARTLAADASDTTVIAVHPRDSGGRLRADSTLAVTVSASAGQLRAGGVTAATVNAEYHSATGTWRATLIAPASEGTISVTANIGGVPIGSVSVLATRDASTDAPAPRPPSSGGGGGGCSLHASSELWRFALMALLLAIAGLFRFGLRGVRYRS